MAETTWKPVAVLSVLTLLYFTTKWLKTICPEAHFFQNHFTDLLFIPVQLTFTLIVMRLLRRGNKLLISNANIYSIVVMMCVLFELILPLSGTYRQTGDWIDCLMYGCGGYLYSLIQKQIFTIKGNRTSVSASE